MSSRTAIALLASVLSTAAVHAADVSDRDAPPTTPRELVAEVHGPFDGEIRWARSTDDRGAVVGYEIAHDGIVLGVVDALSHVDHHLAPGTVHRFAVTAIDSAGQRSGTARVQLVTPDAKPETPIALRGSIYSSTTVELAWDRPPPPFTRYEIRRDGQVVAVTDGTSYLDRTLVRGRRYLFEVIALNRQDRRSASHRLWVTTGHGNMDVGTIALTPVRVEATASLEPIDAVRTLDPMPSDPAVLVHGLGPEALVGVSGRGDDLRLRLLYTAVVRGEGTVHELVEHAPSTDTSTTLAAWPPATAIAVSANGATAALTVNCRANVQSIGAMSTPLALEGELFDTRCAERPWVSSGGGVAVFSVEPDRTDAVYVPASGTVIGTGPDQLPLGEPTLDAMRRGMMLLGASEDGRRLLYLALFTSHDPDPDPRTPRDYTVATLLVDTSTATIDLLARNDYRGRRPGFLGGPNRWFSGGGDDEAVISGDGRVVYYLQAHGRVDLDRPGPPSADRPPSLVRLELDSGVRTTIALYGTKRGLATDRDGGMLALVRGTRPDLPSYFDRDEHVVVYDAERNELVDLGNAARFCDRSVDGGCLLRRYVFHTKAPLFSADGTTLLFEGAARLAVEDHEFAREGPRLLIYDTKERVLHWPELPSLSMTNPPYGMVTNDDGSVIAMITRKPQIDDDEADFVTVRLVER